MTTKAHENNVNKHLSALEARACGKAIILGEHALFYGASAIAIPLKNLHLSLSFIKNRALSFDQNSTLNGEPASPLINKVIQQAFTLLGKTAIGINLSVHSAIPIKAGLGSSASFCVCLIRLLSDYFDISMTKLQVQDQAHQLEHIFHGTPSGLDTWVVSQEKIIHFKKGEAPKYLAQKAIKRQGKSYPWRFVLIDSGQRSSTKHIVKKLASFFQDHKDSTLIDQFSQLSQVAQKGFESGDITLVQKSIHSYYELLKNQKEYLTPKLSEIITISLDLGILAAKPTGSGGGGYVIGLLDPEVYQNQLTILEKKFGKKNILPVTLS